MISYTARLTQVRLSYHLCSPTHIVDGVLTDTDVYLFACLYTASTDLYILNCIQQRLLLLVMLRQFSSQPTGWYTCYIKLTLSTTSY